MSTEKSQAMSVEPAPVPEVPPRQDPPVTPPQPSGVDPSPKQIPERGIELTEPTVQQVGAPAPVPSTYRRVPGPMRWRGLEVEGDTGGPNASTTRSDATGIAIWSYTLVHE
jgi:hypothetical protein